MTKAALRPGVVHGHPDVWSRDDYGYNAKNKNEELFEQLKIATKTHFVSNDYADVTTISGTLPENCKCACSQEGLVHPFIVKHIPTGIRILVGSECIKKFGNEKLNTEVRALKRNNVCEGGNVIPDLRTTDGRLRLCPTLSCRCRLPKCPVCYNIKDSCTCTKCKVCENSLWVCECSRCPECEELDEECTCVTCIDCEKPTWNCRCPRCKKCRVKIAPDGSCNCEICDWCEQFPSKCKCEKCILCTDYKQKCKCKKCQKCRKSFDDGGHNWKKLCYNCWQTQGLVCCADCDAMIPRDPVKKLCKRCYLENL